MIEQLDQLEAAARSDLGSATDAASLEAWRVTYLGTKGRVRAALGATKDVPKEARPAYGQRVNALSAALEEAYKARRAQLGDAAATPTGPRIDVTEPSIAWSRGVGRRHVLSRVIEELAEVFGRMGFSVARGPELEDDEHNFVKLNIPEHHPARDPADNFYVDDPALTLRPRMLRSQTSTVQVRTMEAAVARAAASPAALGGLAEPIRIIAPGRVYRPDTVDATHSFMFHQLEGLAIDTALSLADLKGTLASFARAYFGPEAQIRLRPSFFPFTEPSAELDMMIALNPDQPARWIELGGCGMVHPSVLRACGIDPERWSGFAFGFGIERIAMGKYGIPDIRMLFENDLRFLQQL
ncbi:MAG: phenylalanine--tRNA ligase subunit alpha [Planctomyces sp.]|nr:phenylalanine--tRNA ligase subunit alpha [Planctomyces sp.]MBA4119397.1 phenylalanine--tRNA ligase subunit alpha [Isosphaera sp.]